MTKTERIHEPGNCVDPHYGNPWCTGIGTWESDPYAAENPQRPHTSLHVRRSTSRIGNGHLMNHTRIHGNYTEYDGDDGYTTLTLNRCDTCHMQPQHCDCDSNEPTHDTSRSHIT